MKLKKKSGIREWMKQKFEEVWSRLLKTPRGFVIKTTRKYVAQLFFYEGMNALLERTVDKEDLKSILERLQSLESTVDSSDLREIANDLSELLTLQVARLNEQSA